MANSEIEVKVSVEAVLHSKISELLSQVAEDHGIRVSAVSVDWDEVQAIGGPRVVHLSGLTLKTETGSVGYRASCKERAMISFAEQFGELDSCCFEWSKDSLNEVLMRQFGDFQHVDFSACQTVPVGEATEGWDEITKQSAGVILSKVD